MLGRLARWLRILGFDTAYEAHIADADIVRRAIGEGRVILSRDRRLPDQWRVTGVYLVESERPSEQLREVVCRFDLGRHVRVFTRCSRCNTPLQPASADDARSHVPARILEAGQRLTHCCVCRRFYWSGSHVERMRRIVDRVLHPPGETEARTAPQPVSRSPGADPGSPPSPAISD
jgi:uncharacterized protein with PIN domain